MSYTEPVSGKQEAFLKSLIANRDPADVKDIRAVLNTAAKPENGGVNRALASAMIKALLQIPTKTSTAKTVDTSKIEDGYYVRMQSGEPVVYVVVPGKEGRKYAKRLVIHGHGRAKWEYAKGAIYNFTDASPLTAQEAARLGHLHGVCVVCAKALTDPESVKAGIGPVCESKLPGAKPRSVRTSKTKRANVAATKEVAAKAVATKKVTPTKTAAVKKAAPVKAPTPRRKRGQINKY
jgi:hypothetical protein